MKLEWSAFATSDRTSIFDYLERESPAAAIKVDTLLTVAADRLKRFPEIGRPGRIKNTRELVVLKTPYIIAYRLTDDVIRILRILHGAIQWPDDLPDDPS